MRYIIVFVSGLLVIFAIIGIFVVTTSYEGNVLKAVFGFVVMALVFANYIRLELKNKRK